MRLGGARVAATRGRDRAWRWHLRLRIERTFTLVRAIVTLTVLVVRLTGPPFPGPSATTGWAVAPVALRYCAATAILVFRQPDLASRFWPWYAVADLGLILVCIATTSLQRTPFPALLSIAAVTVPQRMPLAGGVGAKVICTAVRALLAPPVQSAVAVLVALIGTLQVLAPP